MPCEILTKDIFGFYLLLVIKEMTWFFFQIIQIPEVFSCSMLHLNEIVSDLNDDITIGRMKLATQRTISKIISITIITIF